MGWPIKMLMLNGPLSSCSRLMKQLQPLSPWTLLASLTGPTSIVSNGATIFLLVLPKCVLLSSSWLSLIFSK